MNLPEFLANVGTVDIDLALLAMCRRSAKGSSRVSVKNFGESFGLPSNNPEMTLAQVAAVESREGASQ